MPYQSKSFYGKKVELGQYVLSNSVIDRLKDKKWVHLDFKKCEAIKKKTLNFLKNKNYQPLK